MKIGKGRWGKEETEQGREVSWGKISGAKKIVEVTMADINVEKSKGTQLKQNIVSFSVGYLTLEKTDSMDWDWLDEHDAIFEEGPLRHIRTTTPMEILLDSSDGEALILKPKVKAAD